MNINHEFHILSIGLIETINMATSICRHVYLMDIIENSILLKRLWKQKIEFVNN